MTDERSRTAAPDLLAVVSGATELPTMPEVLVRLDEALSSPDCTAQDAADIISRDPAIAANMLRIVNSVSYGLQSRVTSISHAVSVLGFDVTRATALQAGVFKTFDDVRDPQPHFDPAAFWRHAIFAGVAARILGSSSPRFAEINPELLYMAGLLHDIGRIVLVQGIGTRYRELLEEVSARPDAELEIERERLGFTHADVGSMLGILWRLPEELVTAVRYHHNPADAPIHRDLASLVHLANELAWRSDLPSTLAADGHEFDGDACAGIGLGSALVEELLPRIEADYRTWQMPW